MQAVLVQPPFAQLNAPYPAIYYLEAFLRGRGTGAESFDHSIELYRRIFSRHGLLRVFADAKAADGARSHYDEAARSQVERYRSYEGLYLEWIDGLVDFLSGRDPGMAHRIASAVELPRGERAAAFLAERDERINGEESPALATRILEDLGDLVSYALDPGFGTVRYAERIASSRASFADIRAALESSYIMRVFYEPYLEEFWAERAARHGADDYLVLITLPFPGCLSGGLACAAAARKALGNRATIVAGGGYVSTELRGLADSSVFDFFDILSFDAGYGGLASILEAGSGWRDLPLYRCMTRDSDGRINASGFEDGDLALQGERRACVHCADAERFAAEERYALETVFPDYRGVDFGRYLRIVDSTNAMHRLWSDTPWLKYALARGCYWRRCAFCDTRLEYVAGYVPAQIEALAREADAAASRTGLYGIHFVDEAMPMASLLGFARLNRGRAAAGKRPFHFWGNIRYDASWTADRCEYLAASGLVAVSGGIEIATEAGLAATDKGFDLGGLVERLVELRRAGLLVHAYLIYGFPGQTEADIIESAEVCRQLFASGLVDSAFWHRFVLTRHSRMYGEWLAGKRPELRPLDKPWTFAGNDLGFAGEQEYDRFDAPLQAALDAWMSGEGFDTPIAAWFGGEGRVRRPGRSDRPRSPVVDPGLVESLIAKAQARIEAARELPPTGRAYWVAGSARLVRAETVPGSGRGPWSLSWAYRGGIESLRGDETGLSKVAAALGLASRVEGASSSELVEAFGSERGRLAELRGAGLVFI
jgi:radical SAM superfamily enzyme YgiQ (UPF0313 family)